MIKRYLLFGDVGDQREGGWYDYTGNFDTPEEARAAAISARYHWFHVVDSANGGIVSL